MQTIFLSFLLTAVPAPAARLRSVSPPFPRNDRVPGAPAGAPAAAVVEEDDSAALEAAIIGLPNEIAVPQRQKAVEDEAAPQAKRSKEKTMLTKPQQKQPKPQKLQPQPFREVQQAKASDKKHHKKKSAQANKHEAQYPYYGTPPAYVAPSVAPTISTTMEPMTTFAPTSATAVTAGPVPGSAAPVTVGPVADYGSWKMQMEQKLHNGLSSEIKILNTLMTHQTATHQQLLKFKQVLSILSQKYQAQTALSQQQQQKIASLEQQLAGFRNQMTDLNAKFEAYKQVYEQKWMGSQTAIDDLYKKTADALGAMTSVHNDVQQQLGAMSTTAAPPAGTPPPYVP